jgi:uncharacterized membrane protein YjjP (DUF1212 family)
VVVEPDRPVPFPGDPPRRAAAPEPAELQRFLLLLGSALTAAGEAVNEINEHLQSVAAAYGAPSAKIVVLPTFVVVALDPTRPATLEPTGQLHGALRLDQTSALFDVLKRAVRAEIRPADGSREILDLVDMPPRFGRAVTLAGHVVLTVGICLILQPTAEDLALAALFGALVGVLKQAGGRWQRVQMVLPAVAAMIVSALTFFLAGRGWTNPDLRAMIAPLVTFLPGAMLTMAVAELSAAELVTGASRLVAGTVQLILLGFGIVAGAQLAGLSTSATILINTPQNLLGWWAPWLGVGVFGIGVYFYNSAPRRAFPWMFLVLATAWVGQYVGAELFGGYLSGFTGGLAMTVVARAVQRLPSGPPALVSFLPAFWLLVPGSLGLIAITEYLNANPTVGLQDLLGTVGAIAAVAVGVLCGYPLVGSLASAYRRVTGHGGA